MFINNFDIMLYLKYKTNTPFKIFKSKTLNNFPLKSHPSNFNIYVHVYCLKKKIDFYY